MRNLFLLCVFLFELSSILSAGNYVLPKLHLTAFSFRKGQRLICEQLKESGLISVSKLGGNWTGGEWLTSNGYGQIYWSNEKHSSIGGYVISTTNYSLMLNLPDYKDVEKNKFKNRPELSHFFDGMYELHGIEKYLDQNPREWKPEDMLPQKFSKYRCNWKSKYLLKKLKKRIVDKSILQDM